MKTFAPKRKNLLITTIGKRALQICEGWTGPDREYDVMLIYYDKDGKEKFEHLGDFFIVQAGFKYPSLYTIFQLYSDLINSYDYFFLPDDDIEITPADINSLFDFACSKKIAICQPSLTPINYNFEVFVNNPDTDYRYVHMVEVMCPLFSQDALLKCLPSFTESQSGWALDPIWAKLLGNPLREIAVYDGVMATHTIPSNPTNGYLYEELKKQGINSYQEVDFILKKYNVQLKFAETEYVYKEGFPKKLYQLLQEVIDEEDINEEIPTLTLAFYLNIGLMYLLAYFHSININHLIKNYRQDFNNNNQINIPEMHSYFENNKNILIEIVNEVFQETKSIEGTTPWFKRWLDLCKTEIENRIIAQDLKEEALLLLTQKEIINLINNQLKISGNYKIALFYFIEQVFQQKSVIKIN